MNQPGGIAMLVNQRQNGFLGPKVLEELRGKLAISRRTLEKQQTVCRHHLLKGVRVRHGRFQPDH
ncbi:MAG TPA: hypothetical protein VNQ14_00610, partial [Woeseiaceae bacterium]|nr:hypothetical protein [Woeseiaceae bacterium]